MKELLFCYKKDRKLLVRYSILTDVFVPIQDVVSPQKTTIIIPKTSMVELSDIIIIRDNNSNVVEYIGYVDTLTNKVNTEISCYPLINVFDNDYVLDQIFKKTTQEQRDENGKVLKNDKGETLYKTVDIAVDIIEWLTTQLTRAFIDTDDSLQALPFIIRNQTKRPIFHKKIIDTSNLFEIYVDLFINTGVYIVFSGLSYNKNEITGIYCDIYSNNEEKPYYLRYDNPSIQNVDIIDNTFTNYNKLIVTEEIKEEDLEKNPDLKPQRFYFYLLNDNSITRDANHPNRIKQVRSKETTMSIDTSKSDEENAKAMILEVYNELQAPEYNLQITIDMLKDENIKLYKKVDFVSDKTYNDGGIIKNVTYTSNITKLEILNDRQIRITLGALRNSLTDFKKRVEAI